MRVCDSVIKFVVVDDDEIFRNRISEVIKTELFKTDIEYYIEEFREYNKELDKIINDRSIQKVYILDIELGKSISGLEIAKKIRKEDWDSEIIFVTSHDKMFETVFRSVFKVFDFIEKFFDLEGRLAQDINVIINQKSDYGKFTYSNNRIKVQIYYKDITHIYRDTTERKLVINTSNNKFLVNMSLNELLEKLDDRFVRVHRACIVNTKRVNKYNWSKGYFILDNNETVNMCSKLYKGNINE